MTLPESGIGVGFVVGCAEWCGPVLGALFTLDLAFLMVGRGLVWLRRMGR